MTWFEVAYEEDGAAGAFGKLGEEGDLFVHLLAVGVACDGGEGVDDNEAGVGAGDGCLRNVHFHDELANGRITFDYKLRDGIVTKSNGLELMRSIGLDV